MRARKKVNRDAPIAQSDAAKEAAWARARRPEQKQVRREAILSAAIELLDEGGIEATSLSAIARTAGMNKANVYRYFESREDILLTITHDEAQAWLADMSARLGPLAGSSDLEGIADVVADVTLARPRVCALVASLSSVLEHNVGVDRIAEFKTAFIALMGEPIATVMAAVPGLSADQAQEFLTFNYVFIAGVWPMANPPPAVAEVLARPEFASMCVDFGPAVRDHAFTVLRGLCGAD